jgi:O-antigen ligase
MDELLTQNTGSSEAAPATRRSVGAGRTRVLFKRAALIALFALCLYPISVSGLGVNYIYVLLPLVTALVTGRLRNPGEMLLLAIACYMLIFFVASLYQYDLATESTRRFASFAIFISMFSFAFITIDSDKIIAFKTAVVGMSVYLSAVSAYELLELAATRIVGFEAKDLIGTQRLGFIYVIAFWLVYLDRQQKEFWGVARYPMLFVLTVGLCLTFSRASIVSLLVTLLLFAVVRHGGWLKTFNLKSVGNAIITVIGAILIATAVFRVFPLVFQFFGTRLFGFFVDPDAIFNTFADSTSSEGTRLYIASRLLDFVVRNPLTGSGYLGAWVLRDAFGSAHSQYMDVLFRTGPIGFFLYLSILVAMMRYLWRSHEALFWGVGAVLVYGLFHETFKESQGAFVFAFLVGLMAQSWRDRRAARSAARAAARSARSALSTPSPTTPALAFSEPAARNP